MKNKKSSI